MDDWTAPVAQEVKAYGVAIGWKIFASIAILVLLLLSGGLMLLPFFQERSAEVSYLALCLGFGGAGMVLCFYGMLSVFKSRIEIYPDRLKDIGVFKTVELPLREISGYRLVQTQHAATLQIWPKDPQSKKTSLSLTIERKDEFLAWAEKNLLNLDAVDAEKELNQYLDDTQLGETREQRQEVLDRARIWTKILNGINYGAMLWAFFYPEPYRFLVWTLLLLPWVALLVLRRFPGAIKLNAERNSPLPDITPSFLLPCLALALRALMDFDILGWENFWIPFAFVTFLLYVALMFVAKLRKKLGIALMLLLFTAGYGYAATITLNGILDHSARKTYYATVTTKRISHGKHTSYYVRLSPWGPRETEEEVDVGRDAYERRSIGDHVPVVVRQGRFEIPWFYVAD